MAAEEKDDLKIIKNKIIKGQYHPYELTALIILSNDILQSPTTNSYLGVIHKELQSLYTFITKLLKKTTSFRICYESKNDFLYIPQTNIMKNRFQFWCNILSLKNWLNEHHFYGMVHYNLKIFFNYRTCLYMEDKKTKKQYVTFPRNTDDLTILTYPIDGKSKGCRQFISDLVKEKILYAKLRYNIFFFNLFCTATN